MTGAKARVLEQLPRQEGISGAHILLHQAERVRTEDATTSEGAMQASRRIHEAKAVTTVSTMRRNVKKADAEVVKPTMKYTITEKMIASTTV